VSQLSREELAICQRRGHKFRGISDTKWNLCPHCGFWVREVRTVTIEEREDAPPEAEQDVSFWARPLDKPAAKPEPPKVEGSLEKLETECQEEEEERRAKEGEQRPNRDYRKIRLPVLRDGQTVWRTFQGEPLNGLLDSRGVPAMISSIGAYVFRSESGKWVVYQSQTQAIEIYESFEAIRPHISEEVYLHVGRRLGKIPLDQYPEEPLEL
jgi:hypothetical protein